MMKNGKCFRVIECNCWDPLTRIKECSETNVDVQVLSTVPAMFNYWAKPADTLFVSKLINDHIAMVVDEHPKNFLGLGTLPMQDEKIAIKELERCIKDLGLVGIQIGSNVNGVNLNEKSIFSILEAARDLDASIFIHPWDIMGRDEMEKYWLPWLVGMPAETSRAICSMIFGGVFEQLPDLRVAFAHGGGSFPATIGRIQHGFDVRPDLCAVDSDISPLDHLGKFWVDSLVHDIDMLEYLIDKVSDTKIILGSDYPFPLGEESPGMMIENSDLRTSTKNNILFKNAMDWLGLSHGHFL
jgi:aminocarboxymuconate-semialdehyde decarboxylase